MFWGITTEILRDQKGRKNYFDDIFLHDVHDLWYSH